MLGFHRWDADIACDRADMPDKRNASLLGRLQLTKLCWFVGIFCQTPACDSKSFKVVHARSDLPDLNETIDEIAFDLLGFVGT
jgi:hypothetical protein